MLVDHLPPESATITAIRASLPDDELEDAGRGADPAHGRWSSLEMLTAALIDEVRVLQHLYISAHAAKGQIPKAPEPVPRPGVARKDRPGRRRSRLTDEQRRILDPRLRVVQDGETG